VHAAGPASLPPSERYLETLSPDQHRVTLAFAELEALLGTSASMATLLRLAFGSLLAALAAVGVHAQASAAGISTDQAQYQAGDTITICYSVPGPGPVTVTDYSSDGSSAVLLSVYDDGTGWCFPATAQGPASTERLVLSWSSGNQSGSAETVYQVVTASGTHVLTLADANSTVSVAAGDTIQLKLGGGFDWRLTVSDSTVLQASPGPLPADVQGSWVASRPGQATIAGQGDPLCRRSVPTCGAPSRVFSVTIVVTS